MVIPRKILYRVSGESTHGARGLTSKTRYNEKEQDTPKPLLAMSSKGKTRYNNIVSHSIADDNHNGRGTPDYETGGD